MRASFHLSRAAALLALIVLSPTVVAQSGSTADDRAFIASLAADDTTRVDTRRLAKLFFGIGSTLQGDLSSVRLLQAVVAPRDPAKQPIDELVAGRYEAYAESMAEFVAAGSQYLDRPTSALDLFGVLSAGHVTCWRLDAYVRLIDTYGARSTDLVTILATTEACNRFRTVASQGKVRAIVEQALERSDTLRRDVRTLREELEELERLLEDLQRIEKGP
jgi:hypothetical protein